MGNKWEIRPKVIGSVGRRLHRHRRSDSKVFVFSHPSLHILEKSMHSVNICTISVNTVKHLYGMAKSD